MHTAHTGEAIGDCRSCVDNVEMWPGRVQGWTSLAVLYCNTIPAYAGISDTVTIEIEIRIVSNYSLIAKQTKVTQLYRTRLPGAVPQPLIVKSYCLRLIC